MRSSTSPRRALSCLASAVLVLALLGGCATPGPEEGDAQWDDHLAWLDGLSDWRASGRVAVAVPSESWSADLRWRQRGEGFRIQLSGPFGQGGVRIDGDPSGVELRTADGRRSSALTAERLVAAELGVDVPISLLRYWIVGRPAPGVEVVRMDLDWAGRLAAIEQSGWKVEYQDYVDVGSGALPSRLEVRREGMRARFRLSRWQTSA